RRRHPGFARRGRGPGPHGASHGPQRPAAAALLERPPGALAVRPGSTASHGHAPTGRARCLTPDSRRSASCNSSSVLQNANRTSRRPSSGRLKKLDPGTGETPISLVSQTENRSEEHTSELQSRGHLVCRLLLEKKKNQDNSLAAALGFHQPRQLPRLTHHTYRHACP